MPESLCEIVVSGVQQRAGLVEEPAADGRISRNESLILRSKGDAGNPSHDITQVDAGAAVDPAAVGPSDRHGHLIGDGTAAVNDIGSDNGRSFASLHQWHR